jgi:cytoskeletal protein CcmA (bactofilin family)
MATYKTNPNLDLQATVVGPSVRVQGNLSGDEDLHVLGRVDGRIELQRTLVVSNTGIVKAEVTVKNAIVSGVVVGNIHASESVEITRDGRMVGDIYAPRVIIVDGASFRGTVDMGDIENMPTRAPGSERARAPAVTARSPLPARTAMPPRPAPPPRTRTPAPVSAPPPPPPVAREEEEEEEEDMGDEPPQARGLQQKAQRARVVVKRR